MDSFPKYVDEYRNQLKKGAIQQAYKGLMEYIMGLKTYFSNHYPDYFVSGSIYYGYMDMTYFSVIPESLKKRSLKVAIVFIHASCRFEIWLAGVNKQVQTQYWKLFKESGWDRYPVVPTPQGVDAIIEHVLVNDPDFSDLEALTRKIEGETLVFINEIENFLTAQ